MSNVLTQLPSSKASKFILKKIHNNTNKYPNPPKKTQTKNQPNMPEKNQKLVGFEKFPSTWSIFSERSKIVRCGHSVMNRIDPETLASHLWTLPGCPGTFLQVLTLTTENWGRFFIAVYVFHLHSYFFLISRCLGLVYFFCLAGCSNRSSTVGYFFLLVCLFALFVRYNWEINLIISHIKSA